MDLLWTHYGLISKTGPEWGETHPQSVRIWMMIAWSGTVELVRGSLALTISEYFTKKYEKSSRRTYSQKHGFQ